MSKRQKRQDPLDAPLPPELSHEIALTYAPPNTHETYYEPYTPLVGASTQNVTPPSKESKRKKKQKPGPIDEVTVEQNRARSRRYDSFITHLIDNAGDRVAALSLTYGVESEAIKERMDDYLADVMLGQSTSSISELLEKAHLGKAARVGLLARHAYSSDPKVSLVSIKLATDLDGDKHDHGTPYEAYLRMVKAGK